jgi:hypothetical protein
MMRILGKLQRNWEYFVCVCVFEFYCYFSLFVEDHIEQCQPRMMTVLTFFFDLIFGINFSVALFDI